MRVRSVPSSAEAVVEIACDESGSEGEKLVGGTTDVFAHASLDVAADVAVECIAEVRRRARSPAEELKAGVVLREQNRAVLESLLGTDGPFLGNAHVHLVEKEFLLVGRLVALLGGGAAADAELLHRHGPATLGPQPWRRLLAGFNDLMRSRHLVDARELATSYRRLAEGLAQDHAGTPVAELIAVTAEACPVTAAGLGRLLDRTRAANRLDPLVPALARAVTHWAAHGRAVSVVHDEHRTLREAGLDHLVDLCGGNGALAGIRFVDSRADPRVQLADFLAGAARRIASELLNGRGDDALVELLRPYVDPGSVWGHPPSRAALLGGV